MIFSNHNDPMGAAILDAESGNLKAEFIRIESDLSEDDELPIPHLLRNFDQFPQLEQLAMNAAKGRVLDIGAGAGIHALYLQSKGLVVHAIDSSPGAVDYMQRRGISATCIDVFQFQPHEKFDTILLMMNGIGIAGKVQRLPELLNHLTSMLNEGGCILCDSTDVKYFFEDEEGGLWMDLNAEYYGEFQFRMHYDEHSTDWFPWFYIDFHTLNTYCRDMGLNCNNLAQDGDAFLAKISVQP
jgi:SAM-dependent methyltransferase